MDVEAFGEWLEGQALDAPTVDLDKAWHGVHHALTGSAWEPGGELGGVVLGGTEFGEDFGYGPSRWLSTQEVSRLAAALEAMSPEAFAARIDLAAMARDDVYPAVWDRAEEADDLREWLLDGFGMLRAGFSAARDAGDGFVVSLL